MEHHFVPIMLSVFFNYNISAFKIVVKVTHIFRSNKWYKPLKNNNKS